MLARSLQPAPPPGEPRRIGNVESGRRSCRPRPDVYELVWGGKMPHRDRSVDVFVRKVRRKLALCAPEWEFIHTHFGFGCRFKPEQAPE
jgi:DNA-binding response OmpR family regulator